jgi:hypothetical protein
MSNHNNIILKTMRKTKYLIVVLAFTLLSLLVSNLNFVTFAQTQPLMFSSGLAIYSPVNTTYKSTSLTLNLTYEAGLPYSLNYSIDGIYQGPISLTFNNSEGFHMTSTGVAVIQLPALSNGSHILTVNVEGYLNNYHGANPPGAPFKKVSPMSADYFAFWANSVSFTIASSDVTPTLTPLPTVSPNPSVPEFPLLAILPLFLPMLTIAIILKLRKQRTPKNML